MKVPLLNDLAPDGFFYGGHYIVEFDSDSLWYETSLTLAALALKQGLKTEYHVFQHFPSEAIEAFSRLGVDSEKMEKDGLLNIWDSYTDTLKYETEKKKLHGADQNMWVSTRDKPLNMTRSAARWGETAKAGLSEKDKRWLHIDDNTGIVLQYNDEKEVIDAWRTGMVPYAMRARESPHFLAFAKGGASDAFYTKYEALCDGIIDMKAEEVGGNIESYIRVRTLRGKTFDSSWHRLAMGNNGEVRLVGEVPRLQQRRLAAIMFTDMVGYTALGQRNESLSLGLLEEQRKLVRPTLARHNGREVKTIGDAFLVEFPNALDAAKCAYDIQRVVREFNFSQPEDWLVHLRVGIHLGDVVESQGDISGDAVNVASRIESLAPDGGVCLTREVYSQVGNKFELPLISMGPKSLKNVAEPMEVYRMVMPWEKETELAPAQLDRNRIAVLPFVNMSPEPNDEYFADGVTEELISAMSKIEGLEVISRTSVMHYKKNPRTIKEVSRELQVGSVLEGSVRKAGNNLRITVQLIDSSKDRHLWSETYDRRLEDVFATQSEIAQKVADALKVKLLATERTRMEREPTRSIEAFIACAKGVQTIRNGWTEEDTKRAVALFEHATELDRAYAAPYAWLATCYLTPIVTATIGSILPASEATPLAERAIRRAIELDPDLAEAHLASGQLWKVRLNWTKAEEEIRMAIRLNPSVPGGHPTHAWTLASMGRYNEALVAANTALKLDPLSPDTYEALGLAYYCLRNYDEAIRSVQKMGEWGADPMLISSRLGWFYLEKEQYDKALEEWVKAGLKSDLAVLYAKTGRISEARKIMDEVKKSGHVGWGRIEIHLALGEKEEAVRLLEHAYKSSDAFTFTLLYHHLWDEVRSDPRVVALTEKAGLH